MSQETDRNSPDNEILTPGLAERVRDAVGRRTSTLPPAHDGSDTSDRSATTAFARLSNISARHTSSEHAFRERCLHDMGRGRPTKARLGAIKTASNELHQHSIETLRVIWPVIEDLTSPDASSDSRVAVYDLLTNSISHPCIGTEDYKVLFQMLVTPISPSKSVSQIYALRTLVHDGFNVTPFEKELPAYLVNAIGTVFDAALEPRSAAKKSKSRGPIAEEEVLVELLRLIEDIIDHNAVVFEGDLLSMLMQRLLLIANKTTARKDLKQVAMLIRAITSSLQLPLKYLQPCIEVLCGISCTTEANVGEATWAGLKNILASTDQANVIEIMLGILQHSPKDRPSITVRGALLLTKHIIEANGEDGVPIIDIAQLIHTLHIVAPTSSRLQVDSLQILITCLKDQGIAGRLLHCDWSKLGAVIYRTDASTQIAAGPHTSCPPADSTSLLASFTKHYRHGAMLRTQENWKTLESFAYALDSRWTMLDQDQKALALGVLFNVGCYVDNSMLGTALDHVVEDRLVSPLNDNWLSHICILLEIVALDQSKPLRLRCRVLALVNDVAQDSRDQLAILKEMEHVAKLLLRRLTNESEVALTNVACQFLVFYALHGTDQLFEAVLAFVVTAAGLESTTEPGVQPSTPADTDFNRATTHLVWLFQQCLLGQSASRTEQCFRNLTTIAADAKAPAESRLTTMKLLSRMRCNTDYALKVVSVPDSLGLAAALCRTEASAQAQSLSRGNASRASVITESPGGRTGRTSAIDFSRNARSRSTTRSGSGRDRVTRATPPLWMYPGSRGLPIDPAPNYSENVYTCRDSINFARQDQERTFLNIALWLDLILEVLQHGSDWEIYSYILVHLPSQLTNIAFFAAHTAFVQNLHRLVLSQLRIGNFHEPPGATGVKKGDVALCLYNVMTVLVAYREHLSREQLDETVRVFYTGIGTWERAAKSCIHALALCSHEIPTNLRRSLLVIIQKMSQITTHPHLAVDILEFLAALVRLPEAHQIAGPEGQDFLRTVFGICISYIHHAREQREKSTGLPKSVQGPTRHSGLSTKSSTESDTSQLADVYKDLPDYVFTLAYHVLTFWFLAVDIRERSKHVGWIVKNLTWKNEAGIESMEEQSQVTLDMIHRTAYNDLGETQANVDFHDAHGPITKETWLNGMSIITLETVQETGLTLITKRQASGTTHAMYQQYTAPLPPHHVPVSNASIGAIPDATLKVFPQHVLLQLGFTIAPVPIPLQPIILPEDDFIKRAISSFDRNNTVDGHKAGVVYIGPNQTSEASILANTRASRVYEEFLSQIGTKICLQDAKLNTQGLDRESNVDGSHTYAWRDRVTEIVFHVATMMPTVDHDPQCTNKKRHIGNDYVKIIFNDSGAPFRFETFASQFNHVNIVITPEPTPPRQSVLKDLDSPSDPLHQPETRNDPEEKGSGYFIVQTLCSPSFPQVSPTSTPKVISAAALPSFVRQLALNASVLSLVWSNREGGENLSSWRNRLKEIIKLRQRYANTGTSANVSYPGMGNPSDRGGAPSYVDGDRCMYISELLFLSV